jgi:hypothetical protein
MITIAHKLKNALVGLSVLLCFGATHLSAQNVDSKLDASASKLNIGQAVTVNLSVEPENSTAIYTASANLVYDPSKLEFISATTYPEWLELNQKELFVTDTVNGLIIRTAGYPNGFLGTAKFVAYKFKAKKSGNTRILIAAGKAYDENNSDVGLKTTDVNLSILGESVEVPDTAGTEKIIEVNLPLKADNAFYRQDSYTFTLYHKKEGKAQQAITKIWVFDEDWNVHYEDEKLWRTDQDNVLNFVIPEDTIMKEGNFKIIAKVRYEDDREFEVAEKDVGVLSNGQTWFTKNSKTFMPIFFAVIIISALHHIFMEREVYFKLRSMLKKDSKKATRKKK